jgi:hypothetical protein
MPRKKQPTPAMADDLDKMTSDPTSDDIKEIEEFERQERQTDKMFVQKLAACFEEMEKHYGSHGAKQNIEAFLKSPWIKRKLKQDRHRLSERDRDYVANHATALEGEKWFVIQKFAEVNYPKKFKKNPDKAYENAERILRKALKKPDGNILRLWLQKTKI